MKKMLTLLTIGLFAVPLAAGCSSDSQADKAQETQTAYVEAYLAGDVDAQLAVVGADVEFTNAAFNDHREGAAQYERLLNWVVEMTDRQATEVVRRFVSDDGTYGVIEYHWIGSRTDNGEPFDLNLLQVHEYDDDGMVVTVTNYWGDRDVYEQLVG